MGVQIDCATGAGGCLLPIDRDFRKKMQRAGVEREVAIWGPVDPPERLGIRGTYVAVDWNSCTGCGACLDTCPKHVYELVATPGHPTSDRKALPLRESDCVQCYKCEARCPTQAIRVSYPELTGWANALAWVTFVLAFLLPVSGILYGVLYGPSLGFLALFYIGWLVLVLGLVLVLSALFYFRKRGRPLEGRGIMATTMLVDSGTYGIVRHPQFLGVSLVACASILISQHWLFLLGGILFIATFPKWVNESEEYLLAKFGDDYGRYMERVPRANLLLGIIRFLRRRGRT